MPVSTYRVQSLGFPKIVYLILYCLVGDRSPSNATLLRAGPTSRLNSILPSCWTHCKFSPAGLTSNNPADLLNSPQRSLLICWTHLKVKLNPAELLDSPQTQSCWGAAQAAATCCSGTSPWPAGTHVLSGAPARACHTAWSWWPAESCTHPLKPAADRSLLLTLRQCIKNTQLYLTIGGSCHKYHFCHNKHVIVATKQVFCHDKVWLPRQNFCRNKIMFVMTKYFWHDKSFVTTSILLLWQKMCFVQAEQYCFKKKGGVR